MTITKPYLKPTLYSSHPISLLSWSQNSSQRPLYFLPLVSDPSSFANPLQSNIYLHYLRQFLLSGFLMVSLWLNSMNPLQNSPFSTAREMLIMPSPGKHYLHSVLGPHSSSLSSTLLRISSKSPFRALPSVNVGVPLSSFLSLLCFSCCHD